MGVQEGRLSIHVVPKARVAKLALKISELPGIADSIWTARSAACSV